MAGPSDPMPPAGWYPDRPNPPALRWWDGTGWTDDWREFERANPVAVLDQLLPEPEPQFTPEPEPGPALTPEPDLARTPEPDLARRPEPDLARTLALTPEPAPVLAIQPERAAAAAPAPVSPPNRAYTVAAAPAPVSPPTRAYPAPTLALAPTPPVTQQPPEEPAGHLSSVDRARIAGGYPPLGRETVPDRSWMFEKAKRSSQTVAGWLLAVSPLWLGAGIVATLVLLPEFPSLLLQGVAALLHFAITALLVVIDTDRLRVKGHRAPSAAWVLVPLLYFIMRVVRVGRSSVGMLVTYLLAPVAVVGIVVLLAFQTTLLDPVLTRDDGSTGTVTVGETDLSAEERARQLTDVGAEDTLRTELAADWQVGALDCQPFPTDAAKTTTTCLVDLDGTPYTATLETTPDSPTTAFVLAGLAAG